MIFFDNLPSLSPVHCFALTAFCLYSRQSIQPDDAFLIPSTEDLLAEQPFAKVYASWNRQKLSFYVISSIPFQEIGDPNFRRGDSIELFIDTRNLKSKSMVSRFCHHFVFFPVRVQNCYGLEVTRFCGEDIHSLSAPEDLAVEVYLKNDSYSLKIEIPATSLYGYDPINFPNLGFTYQINRATGAPQHFAVSSEEYAIERHPSLWGTLNLIKGKT